VSIWEIIDSMLSTFLRGGGVRGAIICSCSFIVVGLREKYGIVYSTEAVCNLGPEARFSRKVFATIARRPKSLYDKIRTGKMKLLKQDRTSFSQRKARLSTAFCILSHKFVRRWIDGSSLTFNWKGCQSCFASAPGWVSDERRPGIGDI
jgi:hypothetical protein